MPYEELAAAQAHTAVHLDRLIGAVEALAEAHAGRTDAVSSGVSGASWWPWGALGAANRGSLPAQDTDDSLPRSSSNALASCRSAVSKPSVNSSYTAASRWHAASRAGATEIGRAHV